MKIGVVYYEKARSGEAKKELAKQAFAFLKEKGADVDLIESTDVASYPGHYDTIIAVGGDGMILSVAQLFDGRADKYLGIHSQKDSLGIYCTSSWKTYKTDLARLLKNDFTTKELYRIGAKTKTKHFRAALNELAFGPATWGKMFEYELRIGNIRYSSGRATSIIFATPKGSTAYALSAGGPVVDENLDAIIIVPESPNQPQMSNLLIPVTARDKRNLLNAYVVPSAKSIKILIKRQSILATDGQAYLNKNLPENTILTIEKRPSIRLVSFSKT